MAEGWHTRNPTKQGSYHHACAVGSDRHGEASSSLPLSEDDVRVDDGVQLATGTFVVWQRRPWVIAAIREVAPDRWNEQAAAAWGKLPDSDRPDRAAWADRPIYVHLVPELGDSEKVQPMWVPAAASDIWTVLPEHYAVCIRCQELPPCRHELGEEDDSRRATGEAAVLKFPDRPNN